MKKSIRISILIPITLALASASALSFQHPYRLSDRDIKALMSRTEKDAARFRHTLHEELEHRHWREDERRDRGSMNAAASGFERATDRLKDHFHNGNARPEDIREVLERGSDIDAFIVGRHFLPRSRGDWMVLRSDLDQLASSYSLTWSWSDRDRDRDRDEH